MKIELLDKDENVVLTVTKDCKIETDDERLRKVIETYLEDEQKVRLETFSLHEGTKDEVMGTASVPYKKGTDEYLEQVYFSIQRTLFANETVKSYVRFVDDGQ